MAFHGNHMGVGGSTSGMPPQQHHPHHHLPQPYTEHLSEGAASAMLRAMAESGHHPDQHQQQQQQQQQRRHHFGLMHEASPSPSSADKGSGGGGAPTWLSNAVLRQQTASYGAAADRGFLQLHHTAAAAAAAAAAAVSDSQASQAAVAVAASQWLQQPPMPPHQHQLLRQATAATDDDASGDSIIPVPSAAGADSGSPGAALGGEGQQEGGAGAGGGLGVAGGGPVTTMGAGGAPVVPSSTSSDGMSWENARHKAEILSHPLYEQLLSAHVACLRIATPVDQLPRIDAQLAQSHAVVAKYSVLAGQNMLPPGADDAKELDHFMTHYVLLLCSFKEQLQQHVRVHAMEAVMACWELEQSLQSLTGVSPGEGSGATMSDDDDDQGADSDTNLFDGAGLDGGADTMGFGPLVPTESERSLMERVRQELKHELKQGYKEKLVDIREEILRKRRAGKLPGDTTSVLKAWWQSHSKWPYPTEDDKARLVQETGLQLKQINNWFINQRKRNWHSNPSSSTAVKSKKKSGGGDKSGDHFM